MSGTGPAVTWTKDEGVATVTIARVHGNAIDGSVVDGLLDAYHVCGEDPEIRVLVLRGAGKLFCPGLDLQDLVSLDRPAMERFMERFSAAVLSMYAFAKPVVAAVSGHALAGGCVLALTADWRTVRRGALLGLNEVRVGVPLPFGVAQILRESVPIDRATSVALLGRNFKDEEAVAAGLAHEIAEPDAFEAVCRERVEEFLSKDATALAITKRYLRAPAVERIRAAGRTLLPEFLDAWFSPGTRARIAAIVEEIGKRGKA